jgi:hypothetical protein
MTELRIYAFYIKKRQAVTLKRLARRHHISEGEHIRRAIDAYLKKMGVLKRKER